jgi:DeoR/GlpR family transcriptional regulator of sugar metabolism
LIPGRGDYHFLLIFVIIDNSFVIYYSHYVIPLHRQQQLIEHLRREPGLSVPQLATRLGVSPGTIRNDLAALARSRQVVRVRGGGAVLATDPLETVPSPFFERTRLNETAKQAIGRKAAEIVQDGSSVLLDASTTVYHLAQHLTSRRDLRVVTNGIEVAQLLSQNPTHMVMLVGGTLRAGKQSVTGPWSLRQLEEVRTRFAFVSCSGFTPQSGMTEVDVYEAEFRQKAIESAIQSFALIDSSKYGQVELSPSVRLNRIDQVFTDTNLSEEWITQLNKFDIPYTLCE